MCLAFDLFYISLLKSIAIVSFVQNLNMHLYNLCFDESSTHVFVGFSTTHYIENVIVIDNVDNADKLFAFCFFPLIIWEKVKLHYFHSVSPEIVVRTSAPTVAEALMQRWTMAEKLWTSSMRRLIGVFERFLHPF